MSLEDLEMEEEIRKSESLNTTYKWLSMVEKLAKGDITKFEAVYKQNYMGALNLLSYWKELDIRQQEINRKRK